MILNRASPNLKIEYLSYYYYYFYYYLLVNPFPIFSLVICVIALMTYESVEITS